MREVNEITMKTQPTTKKLRRKTKLSPFMLTHSACNLETGHPTHILIDDTPTKRSRKSKV